MAEGTKVNCQRKECSCYQEYAGDSQLAWCTHPDKPHYQSVHPCPLFRLNFRWQAQGVGSGSAMDFLKVIRKR